MAKKTNTKKSAAKPSATTPVVPESVVAVRKIATSLGMVKLPNGMLINSTEPGSKLIAKIDAYATRIEKFTASTGKKAEKETAKAKRAEKKTERDKAKKVKKIAARDALRAKLAKMEKDLES